MEVISQASKTILAILKTPKRSDCRYRKMHFCVEHPVDQGVLLYHTLTKELIFLTREEYDRYLELEYLRQQWFVVPEDTNDKQCADLVKWVLSARLKQKQDIVSYTIFPTTDCNARCFYCYELGRSRIPMSRETALKAVQYIKNHCGGKKISISWFGGEPLYNQMAIDTICTGLREEGIAYSSTMTTNAYLFDADTVKKAAEFWNVQRVQITLDGTEAVYNRVKAFVSPADNPYQRVLHNIEMLLDASVSVTIRMNMDLHNAENLILLAQELAQRFGHRKNIGAYVRHLFKGNESLADAHTAEEWELRDEYMRRIEEKLDQVGMIPRIGVSTKMRFNHCMADSGNAVTILPDGNVGVCEHFSETEFVGHLDRDDLDVSVLNSWKEKTPPIAECVACFHYPDCVMLKKCPNGNKCFLQHRELIHRSTARKMENEYRRWQSKEELPEENQEFC